VNYALLNQKFKNTACNNSVLFVRGD